MLMTETFYFLNSQIIKSKCNYYIRGGVKKYTKKIGKKSQLGPTPLPLDNSDFFSFSDVFEKCLSPLGSNSDIELTGCGRPPRTDILIKGIFRHIYNE